MLLNCDSHDNTLLTTPRNNKNHADNIQKEVTHSYMANIASMILSAKTDQSDEAGDEETTEFVNASVQCNQRPVSEINMTCIINDGQTHTMEQIIKGKKGTERTELTSALKVILYETITEDDNPGEPNGVKVVSMALCDKKKKKKTAKMIQFQKIGAKPVTTSAIVHAMRKMKVLDNYNTGE